jgi:putative ABC transport system permease protein
MIVSPTYLQTLDVPLLSGRGFDDRDAATAAPVCLVSENFVRKYFGSRSPIGARVAVRPMSLGLAQPIVRQVVGVVGQMKGRPDSEDEVQLYVPLAQNPWADSMLVVRSASGPAAMLAPAVRATISRVDREQPVTRVRTLDEVAWESTARPRFRAALVATFAGLALALAMVGVFGVLAYSVQQRWREFGVRMALGASTKDVISLVIRAAARVIGAGVVIGLAGAAATAGTISAFLYGVEPWDLPTFAAVSALLMATGIAATLAPALRASRVDPVVAFRADV